MAADIKTWATGRWQQRVNGRLLLATLVIGAVLAGALYFWHEYSMGTLSDSFKTRAGNLAEANQFEQASLSLLSYLKLKPEDASSRITLAEYYDKATQARNSKASISRSIELYFEAIAEAPESELPGLRHRLAERLFEARRYNESETIASQVKDDEGLAKSAKRIAGLAAFAQIRMGTANARPNDPKNKGISIGERLHIALQSNPGDTDLTPQLAELYRIDEYYQYLSPDQQAAVDRYEQQQRDEIADQLVDDMVEIQENPASLLTRFRYRRKFDIPGRTDDLQRAFEIAPDNADVNYELGIINLQNYFELQKSPADDPAVDQVESKALLEASEIRFTETIRHRPQYVPAYLALGKVFALQQREEMAIEKWEDGLRVSGDGSPEIFSDLIDQLVNLERFAEAEDAISRCNALIDRLQHTRSLDREDRRKIVQLKQNLLVQHARLLIKQNRHLAARPLLRNAIALDLTHGRMLVPALAMLAECFSTSGMTELAADCWQRASAERPNDPELWGRAGSAWMNAYRPDLALDYFGKLASTQPSAESWLQLAIARRAVELTKPEASRDWSEFDAALSNAKKLLRPESSESNLQLELLDVSSRLLRDQDYSLTDAESRIARAAEGMADDPTLLQQLMMFYQQLGNSARADLLRKRLVDSSGNTSQRYMAEANLLIARGEMESAKNVLQQALTQLPATNTRRIEVALIELELLRGRNARQAFEELKKQWSDNRDDLSLHHQLATFAIFAGFISEQPDEWENELELIEEPGGSFATCLQGYRYLLQAKNAAKAGNEVLKKNYLDQARNLQRNLYSMRPLWSITHTLAGEIAEFNNDRKMQAIDHYKTAIRFGERRHVVLLKLVYLLFKTNQLSEANELLPLLGDPTKSPLLSAIAQDIWVNLDQLDRAEELAIRLLEQRAKGDVGPLIGYGQILIAKNNTKKAEELFRQALAEDNQNSTVWLSLFNLYLRTDEKGKAEQAMNAFLQLLHEQEVSEVDRAFVRAQSYELLRDPRASGQFQKAMELAPENVQILSRSALYFARQGNVDQAINILRRLHEISGGPSADHWAMLAAMLAERGTESDWIELKKLLTGINANDENAVASRLYAMLLSIKNAARNSQREKNLEAALKVLEESGPVSLQSASNHLAFAMVYRQLRDLAADSESRESRTQSAVEHYAKAANCKDVNPAQLRMAATFFLQESMLDEASRLISRLVADESNAAKQHSIATLKLRVSLRQKRGQLEEIDELLSQYVSDVSQQLPATRLAELYRVIGDVCLSAGLYPQADHWYQRGNDGSIEVTQKRMVSLTRQGKTSAAVRQAINQYDALSDSVANRTRKIQLANLVCNTLVRPGSVQPSEFEIAEPMLTDAERQFSDVADVCNAIATVRLVQGNRKLAIEWFRKGLIAQSNHVMLLNNLATTLSEDPQDADEALRLINLAIDAAGEQAALLDTKAAILIHDHPEQAEQLLRDLENENADPRIALHLAIALHRQGKTQASQEYLEIAIKRGVERAILTQWQQSQLEILRTEFATAEFAR